MAKEPPEYLCTQCKIVGRDECCWPKRCEAAGPRQGYPQRLKVALIAALLLLSDINRRKIEDLLKEGDL